MGFDAYIAKLRKLQTATENLSALIGRELPEAKLYPTQAVHEIWQGLGEIRMAMLNLFHEAVRTSDNGTTENYWRSRTDAWVNSFAPLNKYGTIINAARDVAKSNVVFPDYGFKPLLRLQLKTLADALLQARAMTVVFSLGGDMFDNVSLAVWGGIERIYRAVKAVVGGAVNIAKDLIEGASFLYRYAWLIAAGAGYYFFVHKKGKA